VRRKTENRSSFVTAVTATPSAGVFELPHGRACKKRFRRRIASEARTFHVNSSTSGKKLIDPFPRWLSRITA